MKKILPINLGGEEFRMDENAYDYLKTFFQKMEVKNPALERALASEIREIITSSQIEIVSFKIVQDAINKVNGKSSYTQTPTERNNISGEEQSSENSRASDFYYRRDKRLYRDVESRVFAGICSGLGYYYRCNPVLFRLLFVVLFFITSGSFLLVYLVLWIVLPKANTLGKRMHMTGDDYVPSSDSISEDTPIGEKHGFGWLLQKMFGISLMIIGIGVIVSTVLAVLFLIRIYPDMPVAIVSPFIHGFPLLGVNINILYLLIFSGMAVVVIPLFLLFIWGINLVFGTSASSRFGWISTLFVWLIAFSLLAFSSIKIFSDVKDSASIDTTQSISIISDTLKLSANSGEYDLSNDVAYEFDNLKILKTPDDDRYVIISRPQLNILRSDSTNASITYKRESRGNGFDHANDNAMDIQYDQSETVSNSISFDQFFVIPDMKWRGQSMEITISIPDQQVVYLDESLLPILNYVYNASDLWLSDMVNKYWKMTPEGLIQVNKNGLCTE